MNEIQEEPQAKFVHFEDQRAGIRVWWNGDIDINVYTVPTEALENIAKITGKTIKENSGTRWIQFAKARDKSEVTLFEA